jgi:SAM-dependent methyltransferase
VEDWSSRAAVWAEHWASLADPARRAVADAAGIAEGMRVLDVGCGTGEFCALISARGAHASGIDDAEGMIALARERAPEAELRVGTLERLPWPDESFDLVTAFNALQFAPDFVDALREAARVTRRGGAVAVCNWGSLGKHEMIDAEQPLRALVRHPPEAARARMEFGDPAVLDELVRRAGLEPRRQGSVDIPYEVPDEETLVQAFMFDAMGLGIPEDRARPAIAEGAAAFRRPDGSYRLDNEFIWVVAGR